MENIQLWYYFSFIAAALVSVVFTHLYLKAKLGPQHDNSLLWLALGLGIWLLVILIEWKILPLKSEIESLQNLALSGTSLLPEQKERLQLLENKQEFPTILRRFLSIFNSAAMILFLSYFREGWTWLNQKVKKLTATPELFGLVILAVCIGSALVDKTFWLGAETTMSILVVSFLTIGFTLSFWRREQMRWMCILALAGGLLLVLNQLALLAQEDMNAYQWLAVLWPPADDLIFRRMLALLILMSNTWALALTWLGEQTQATQAPAEASFNNLSNDTVSADKIEFRYENSSVTVYLSLSKPNSSNTVRLDFNEKELTPPKRSFLFKHAQAAKNQKFVKSRRFNNFSKERDEVLEMLNRKAAPYDFILSADALFVRGREIGEYRLRMEPDMIWIDEEAESFLKEKK